jgi:hypothetical protein
MNRMYITAFLIIARVLFAAATMVPPAHMDVRPRSDTASVIPAPSPIGDNIIEAPGDDIP